MDEFIIASFQWVLGATPSVDEITVCRSAIGELHSIAKANGNQNPERRAAENFILALLNCNDFITIR